MIHFIIYEDNLLFIKHITNIIHSVMMLSDLEYKILTFSSYDENMEKIIHGKLSFKIYILDIVAPIKTGIEVARMIRAIDTESMLIFLTAYYEDYLKIILKSKFMFLNFINKEEDYVKELTESIHYALENIHKKNIIRFKNKGMTYTIASNDILYITREKDRTCTIKTDYNEFSVWKSLTELKGLLDNDFCYSYRSCVVNKTRIQKHDMKNRIITFDDGTEIDLVSSKFNLSQ